jgi:hypothetical protein
VSFAFLDGEPETVFPALLGILPPNPAAVRYFGLQCCIAAKIVDKGNDSF